MEIGSRIKAKRKEKRFTQIELADLVNVSSQVISNWERGYSDLSSDDVARLADALECSTEYLLGKTDDPKPINEKEERFQAFINDPELERWYKELPKNGEEDLRRLRRIWEAFGEEGEK